MVDGDAMQKRTFESSWWVTVDVLPGGTNLTSDACRPRKVDSIIKIREKRFPVLSCDTVYAKEDVGAL